MDRLLLFKRRVVRCRDMSPNNKESAVAKVTTGGVLFSEFVPNTEPSRDREQNLFLALVASMEPFTFSVTINTGKRFDHLRSDHAVQHSGLFKSLFSLPDSDEMRKIRRGEPICITHTCYDLHTTDLTDEISPVLLEWVYGLFRVGKFDDFPYCSLDDYYHALQIATFLDIARLDKLTDSVLSRHPLREVLQTITPTHRYLSDTLKMSLTYTLGPALKEHFYYDRPWSLWGLDMSCRVVIDLILKGANFDSAMDSMRDTILDSPSTSNFFRWEGMDVSVHNWRACRETVKDLYDFGGGAYMGFLFSTENKKAEPAGVFVLYPREHHPNAAVYSIARLIKGTTEWVTSTIYLREHVVTSDPLVDNAPYPLEPYCVMNENMYRDEVFVNRVLEALGMTLGQIRDAQETINKSIP